MDKKPILQNYQLFKVWLLIAIYILSFFAGSLQYTYAQDKPQNVLEKQPNNIEDIISQLDKVINDEKKPGLLLCIVKKDSVLYDNGLGFADLDTKRMVDKQTLFRMGSITKTFTSMAILSLAAEGKIKLTDEIKKIAPEIIFENSWEATNPVRIIHLLEHTAGFDDVHFKAIYNPKSKDFSSLDAVKVNSNSLISRWQPGERYSYSNPGYAILGYLIEKYSGKPWNEYIKEKLLLPLGMNHTNFDLRITQNGKYATAYKLEKNINSEIPFYAMYDGASGSLNSTSEDMAKFVQFFLNDWEINGIPWLPVSVLNDMETGRSSLAAENGMLDCYGMGNSPTAFDAKVIFHGHNGGFPGFLSKFAYNRKLGVGYAICNNNETDNSEIVKILTDFLTQNQPNPKPIYQRINTETMKPYFGYYQFMSPRYELLGFIESLLNVYSFEPANDKLLEESTFGERDTLVQVSVNKFRKSNFKIATFLFATNVRGEEILIRNGEYYSKVNVIWLRLQQCLFVLSLVAILVGFLMGFGWLISVCIKKQNWASFEFMAFPFIIASLFISFTYAVLYISENYLKSLFINGYTITIFIGTLLFAIFSLVNIFLLLKKWNKQKSRWLNYFLLTLAILYCYLDFILFQNNWIGLRTWAY
jgi:CubicO group peptidase (beta-lactamase class C family)